MSCQKLHYQLFQPPKIIESWVKYYWWLTDSKANGNHDLVIPDGSTELIFNWGSGYERSHLNRQDSHILSRSCLVGQRNHSVLARRLGPSKLIGIKFRPGALKQLFGIPEVEFRNQVIDFSSLALEGLDRLEDSLFDCHKIEDAITLINAFLLPRLCVLAGSDQVLAHQILGYIQDKQGIVSLNDLHSHFQLHPKKLERLFNTQVGLSPKNYLRVTRFKQVYKQINRQAVAFYDQSIYDWGYYDQMHFIKEFKTFTGQSPSSYYKGESAISDQILTDTLVQLKRAV